MVDVYGKARKAQESQYRDTCTVYEYRDVTDEKSRLTRKEETAVLENLACRLSFELLYGTVQTDTGSEVPQRVKLFIAPEVKIPAGCKIRVTLSGGEVLRQGCREAVAQGQRQDVAGVCPEAWQGCHANSANTQNTDVTPTERTLDYGLSGAPAVYPTHQEIRLEPFKRWS